MMCLLHVVSSYYADGMYKDINPFGLRLPTELRIKAEEAAVAHHRSLNAELVARIQESFEERHELAAFNDGELIQELISRYGRDGIYIRIGREQQATGAIQEAIDALNAKLADSGADHAEEENKQRNQNR